MSGGSVFMLLSSPFVVDYVRKRLQNVPVHYVVKSFGDIPVIEELPDIDNVTVCMSVEYSFEVVMKKYPTIKWYHSMTAGNAKAMASLAKLQEKPLYTKNIKGYDKNMSEFVISHILCHEKRILDSYNNQQLKLWRKDFHGARYLSDVTVGILGLGNIGKTVAKLCSNFDMKIWALTRVEPTEKISFIDQYSQNLEDILVNCDYIAACLPSTPVTKGFLDGDVLSACKKKPVLINVGRGDLINEESVIKALRNGWIKKAVLDAFTKEPLPKSSPLWSEPGVIVSPHCSYKPYNQQGLEEIAEGFLENYHRFIQGKELVGAVSIDKHY